LNSLIKVFAIIFLDNGKIALIPTLALTEATIIVVKLQPNKIANISWYTRLKQRKKIEDISVVQTFLSSDVAL
jgi:hypothetical protein